MDRDIQQFELVHIINRLKREVAAYSIIEGSDAYSDIKGLVVFSNAEEGSYVDVEVRGLPGYRPADQFLQQPIGPFGFHIHEGGECEPRGNNAFENVGGHYNPDNQPHGNHAGDLPVLFSNNGYSQMSFYTDRFTPGQVIGRAVVIHLSPDDYRTQPAGDSGERIACGVIVEY